VLFFDLVASGGGLVFLARFREWRAKQLSARAANTRPQRDYTAVLISNAARETFRKLFSPDVGEGRRARRGEAARPIDEYDEADWFGLISAGAAPMEAEADASSIAKSLRIAEEAFLAGNDPKIIDATQRVVAYLAQHRFDKACVMYACDAAL